MTARRGIARFNKRVTNPIQGMWAPRTAPYAVVLHRGRKSGNGYRTPVVASVHGSTIVIALPYGSDADWVRNILAAGGGEVIRKRVTYRLDHPRIVVARGEGADPSAHGLVTVMAKQALIGELAQT